MQLHQQHHPRVVCISLNLDYIGTADEPAESFRGKVESFVKSRNADFEHLIASEPDTEIYAKSKLTSVPAVLVYGPDGNVARQFDFDSDPKGFTYERDIGPYVVSLLGK